MLLGRPAASSPPRGRRRFDPFAHTPAMADPNLSSFIWSVADLLRGDYKQSEYGKVILPFTVLRRLDCVLEKTKPAVLAELEKRKATKVNPEPFLLKKSGQLFFNTSPLDMKKLMGDQDHIKSLSLGEGDSPKLEPLTEAGGGALHDKQQALMAEIIQRVNDLFEGDLTVGDQLVYVNNVIKGKLLESAMLGAQADNNTKEQFSNSPDLTRAIRDAVMDALDAHTTMSTQALDSERVMEGLKAILLGPAQLYESLRARKQRDG